jgi:hypothetical protein
MKKETLATTDLLYEKPIIDCVSYKNETAIAPLIRKGENGCIGFDNKKNVRLNDFRLRGLTKNIDLLHSRDSYGGFTNSTLHGAFTQQFLLIIEQILTWRLIRE